jgi:hypothetical protein
MPKVTKLRLLPSGAKLKDVAESSVVIGFLIGSFLEVAFKEKPDLADKMADIIRSYDTPAIKPEYRALIRRALQAIAKG